MENNEKALARVLFFYEIKKPAKKMSIPYKTPLKKSLKLPNKYINMEDYQNKLKQAERDRDMALIGDAVHLLAQGAAMHGGAWKIGKPTNFTEQANKRIMEIKKQERERLLKQNAALTKLQQTETKAKQQQLQFDAKQKQQQQQFDTKQKQQQQQFDTKLKQQQLQFDTKLKQQQLQFDTKKQQPQTKNKTAYDTYQIYQPENRTYKEYPNVHAAYNSLPQGYKAVKIYLDNTGRQLIVEDPHPTVQKMQQMINIHNYTKENGIEYDGFDTQPFNIEEGYSGYEDKDLQTPTYNPDGSMTFKKVSDQPVKRRKWSKKQNTKIYD